MSDKDEYFDQVVDLLCKLIAFETHHSDGVSKAIRYLDKQLIQLGMTTQILHFEGRGSFPVDNLYGSIGNAKPDICFLGHVDVVPPGDGWNTNPYEACIRNGALYGRGAVDMKSSVACFIAAMSRAVAELGESFGKVSIIVSGDEENEAINGTSRVVEWMLESSRIPDICLVGEPTSQVILGDTIKVGRRGSLLVRILVRGQQGHSAYPIKNNATSDLAKILFQLSNMEFDQGTKEFGPTCLSITSLNTDLSLKNVVPSIAEAVVNIRYNSCQNSIKLTDTINRVCSDVQCQVEVEVVDEAVPFFSKLDQPNQRLIERVIQKHTSRKPKLSTSGGTSDARFIFEHCTTFELGPQSATAHCANEKISLEDLRVLYLVYFDILKNYFVHRATEV